MAILHVGATEKFSSIAGAVSAAHTGDTISIDAGHYMAKDILLKTNLTITAAGNGPVVLHGSGLKKGMFISGSSATTPNVTINGLTFENAASPSGNGAGVRYQSGNLTLTNDTFRNNQDGVLATPFIQDTGTIVVQGSTFDHNGIGSGLGHNLYIDKIADFVMTNSVSEHAVVGHEIKSRAFNNDIENNLIADGPTGTSSYSIDLPNGGNAMIRGNVIEQGPHGKNPNMIAFGEGGASNPGSLTVSGNVLLNDLPNGRGVWNASHTAANVTGNQVWGLSDSSILHGVGIASANAILAIEPALTSPAKITSGSTTVASGGSANGITQGTTAGAQLASGMRFIGGSSNTQIAATDAAADLAVSTPTAGTADQPASAKTAGVMLSDLTTGHGAQSIVQGATADTTTTGSFGWTVEPSNTSPLFANHAS